MQYRDVVHEITRQKISKLRKKPARFWPLAAVAITVGILISQSLDDDQQFLTLRYQLYHALQSVSHVSAGELRDVVVIAINDSDYWFGELAHRVPLKRTYLARLIDRLDSADSAVVGVDVLFRAATADTVHRDSPDYREETEALVRCIARVAKRTPVIVTSTFQPRMDLDSLKFDPTIFTPEDLRSADIQHGYANLMVDGREMPESLPLADGTTERSFAEAIVHAYARDSLVTHNRAKYPSYVEFYPDSSFPQRSAGWLLSSDLKSVSDFVRHRIVLIGGAWQVDGFKRGRIVDGHLSPVGTVAGVFLHANYIVAMLRGEVRRSIPKEAAIAIDVLASLLVVLAFALPNRFREKFTAVIATLGGLLFMSYLVWQNLGHYFDAFIPIVFVSIHGVYEYVRELKEQRDHLLDQLKDRKEQHA